MNYFKVYAPHLMHAEHETFTLLNTLLLCSLAFAGSSNGRSKAGTLSGRRSPPKQTLMDMIPPPPLGAPPPESQIGVSHWSLLLLISSC